MSNCSFCCLGIVAIPFVLWYCLLRFRLVSKRVMQYWFILTVVCVVVPAALAVRFFTALQLIGCPAFVTTRVSNVQLALAMRICSWCNPQIQMRVTFDRKPDGKLYSWDDLKKEKNMAVMMNHTSFWDTFCFCTLCPTWMIHRTRSLMKAKLGQIPIMGYAFSHTGHFLVHFKSDDEGNFHVDQEKQAEQTVLIEDHLKHGGSLAFFPEGAINKTPPTLLPFRFGSFNTVHQYRLPIFYMVTVGNEKTWPGKAAIGGFPADIHVRVGGFPVNYDDITPKDLSIKLQEKMQAVYTEVYRALPVKSSPGHTQ